MENGIEYVFIWKSKCWKCKSEIRLLKNHRGINDYFSGTEGSLDPEILIKLAKQYGARLEKRFSKTANQSYFMNICQKCGTHTGNWFLNEEFLQLGYHKTQEIYSRSCVYDGSLENPFRNVNPDNLFHIEEMWN